MDARSIAEVLRSIFLTQYCPSRFMELIVGHGELWSAQVHTGHSGQKEIGKKPHIRIFSRFTLITVRIPAQVLCAYLRATGVQAGWLDARQVLVVEEAGQYMPD